MLHIENLCAGYGDVDVVHNVTLDVLPNEVVGVLGCNGAGKTTLVKAVMGLLPRVSGEIAFLGQPLTGLRTHEIARRGIGLVPQGRWIFPKLTVRENLLMGTQAAGGADILDEVFDYFPVLKVRLSQQGGTLSGGEQQVLAIARALCGRPKLLLLDEPSDGVQPNLVERIGEVIPELCRRSKLSVLLVEQNLDLVLQSARVASCSATGGSCMQVPLNRNAERRANTRSRVISLRPRSPYRNSLKKTSSDIQ